MRLTVIKRADGRCEYCLYPQAASFLAFEIEHISAEKHGGKTVLENLALACPYCNRYSNRFKGTDLGSLDPESGLLIPFFNPRSNGKIIFDLSKVRSCHVRRLDELRQSFYNSIIQIAS
jgi:hypothetical protein